MNTQSVFRQRLWRWHFFAGLLVCPFAILLAVTGSLYLFKPQIDDYVENTINAKASAIDVSSVPLSYDQLLSGLLEKHPQAQFKQLVLAKENDQSIEIELIQGNGQVEIFWLDQYSGTVLDRAFSDERFLAIVKDFHAELLLGNGGSYTVELMASWMIILILTGLYLWLDVSGSRESFKKKWRRWLIPQLKSARARINYKSLHAVIGVWFTLPILVLLFSGLPWTQLWGSGFKMIQEHMGWRDASQQWSSSVISQANQRQRATTTDVSLWQISSPDHTHSNDTTTAHTHKLWDMRAIEIIVQQLKQENLVPPIQINPPNTANQNWIVRTMSQQRSERVTIHYDNLTAQEVMRTEFADHHIVQRFISQGISLHEGVLFGWLNQLLGLLTAIAIIALSCFGLVTWWRRRPRGELAPPPEVRTPITSPIIYLIIFMGILLPAAGISFAAVVLGKYAYARFRQRHN